MLGADAPPAAPGVLYWSMVPPSPAGTPNGCVLHLAVPSAVSLATFTTTAFGTLTVFVNVPPIPSCEGTSVIVQAVFLTLNGTTDYALSDALLVTFGF